MKWLNVVELLTALSSLATAIGVLVAAYQIRLTRQLARTQFEDDLTRQYREITKNIPVEALLGGELDKENFQATFDDFFRYVDLTNEQVFWRQIGRVSTETWELWCDGIKATLSLPAFKEAWGQIKDKSNGSFQELRRLEDSEFKTDPYQPKRKYLLLRK